MKRDEPPRHITFFQDILIYLYTLGIAASMLAISAAVGIVAMLLVMGTTQ